MLLLFLGVVVWSQWMIVIRTIRKQNKPSSLFGRRKVTPTDKPCYRFIKKPDWVPKEIIHMKALMPELGCRKLADSFNRRFNCSKQMTVGKTYVSNVIQKSQYEIQILRKNIKHRKPKPLPKNLIWGIDLTGKSDTQNKTLNIFGIVDHGSRGNLCLRGLKNKASITLLRHLLDAIEQYGKPKVIRTDNESIFISRLFKISLWLLNIKHQHIDKGCPWMNGRVERFFGTLKERLNHWEVDNREQLNRALVQFQFWYNHVRPHQHLEGRTPSEVWQGTNIYTQHIKKEYWFEAWDGLLTGYYLRL
jgi:transposase InsO family protein